MTNNFTNNNVPFLETFRLHANWYCNLNTKNGSSWLRKSIRTSRYHARCLYNRSCEMCVQSIVTTQRSTNFAIVCTFRLESKIPIIKWSFEIKQFIAVKILSTWGNKRFGDYLCFYHQWIDDESHLVLTRRWSILR